MFASLAKKLSHIDTVSIAAMDATANKVPSEFDVKGYPTLYFLKANDKKKPISYEGGREEGEMLKFIQDNASKKFTL